MSIIVDDTEHEREIESNNERIMRLLAAIVLLLETIADVDVGSTIENIRNEED